MTRHADAGLGTRDRIDGVVRRRDARCHADRKEILLEAIRQDPLLDEEVNQIVDSKERNRMVDNWLQTISRIKAHPISCAVLSDELDQRVLDAYDAGLRACGVIFA